MNPEIALDVRNMTIEYADGHIGVRDLTMAFAKHSVTAIIGPSGCGKSTALRAFNRMNELIPDTKTTGQVLFHGLNIYDAAVDAVQVRRNIGMVFQKPNPFPKSIWENIAWGARINGWTGDMDELVESSLRQAALWDEVKDKLKRSAYALSGGQQQRLCIARALALKPEILLMDEPTRGIDVAAKGDVFRIVRELSAEGLGVVFVTSELKEILAISDRVVVLSKGRITGVFNRAEATEEKLVAASAAVS